MFIRSIGIAGLIIGTLFKIMHWPGANIIIVLGGVLASVSAVMLVLVRPRPLSVGELLRPAAGILIIGFLLLKLLHLPFATLTLVGAAIAVMALLIVERNSLDLGRIVSFRSPWLLGISVGLAALGSLFKVMHWPGASVMLILGMTGSAVWFLIAPARVRPIAG